MSAEVLSITSRASYIDIYLKGILNSSTKISSPTKFFVGVLLFAAASDYAYILFIYLI
jgi:hypothetical protein